MATMPAAMLTDPSSTSAHHGEPSPRPRIAATTLKTPSTSAYAPKSRTRTASVTPGNTSARMPKTIAAIPRSASAHQFLARVSISTAPPSFLIGRRWRAWGYRISVGTFTQYSATPASHVAGATKHWHGAPRVVPGVTGHTPNGVTHTVDGAAGERVRPAVRPVRSEED